MTAGPAGAGASIVQSASPPPVRVSLLHSSLRLESVRLPLPDVGTPELPEGPGIQAGGSRHLDPRLLPLGLPWRNECQGGEAAGWNVVHPEMAVAWSPTSCPTSARLGVRAGVVVGGGDGTGL